MSQSMLQATNPLNKTEQPKKKKGWKNSKMGMTLRCLSLCEVINAGYVAKPHFVVPNEDHVSTRYFFVYTDTSTAVNVESKSITMPDEHSKMKTHLWKLKITFKSITMPDEHIKMKTHLWKLKITFSF